MHCIRFFRYHKNTVFDGHQRLSNNVSEIVQIVLLRHLRSFKTFHTALVYETNIYYFSTWRYINEVFVYSIGIINQLSINLD